MTNRRGAATLAGPAPGQAMPEFYDTHAHLDFPDFRGEEDAGIGGAPHPGILLSAEIGKVEMGVCGE